MATLPEAAVGEKGLCGVVPGRASHSAARMRARAAKVQALERHSVIRRSNHRSSAEQLIETHLSVEDIAADQAKAALEVEWRMNLPAKHRLGEAGRVLIDRGNDGIGRFFPFVVPASAGAKVVTKVLTEERGDVLALRRQRRVQRRRDEHLDDRLLRPS